MTLPAYRRTFPTETAARNIEQAVANTLDPIVAIPWMGGVLLEDVSLTSGANTIDHKLGREIRGWFVVRIQGATATYPVETASDSTSLSLTIGANATPANYLDGRVSMAWLCCEYLSDAIVATIWEQTRAMFGE